MKADVQRIPKMWYFLRFRGFKPELLLPKVRSFSKYLFLKIVAVGFFLDTAYFWGQIENFRLV